MTLNRVFIDTSYFKAGIDEKDEFHTRALAIAAKLEEEEAEFVTTNFVLDEAFTLLRIKSGVESARKFYKFLAETGNEIELVRVSAKDEKRAWNWFWNDWSKLSFTDCTSFAVMERLGIKRAATFDDHFAKARFETTM
ncbi:MAG: PIN domain-containing protein [Patescibacteria group bacterium]